MPYFSPVVNHSEQTIDKKLFASLLPILTSKSDVVGRFLHRTCDDNDLDILYPTVVYPFNMYVFKSEIDQSLKLQMKET